MGRPRKTAEEHKANGTFRPSRGHAVQTALIEEQTAESFERPAKLDPKAGLIWDELVELLKGSIRRRDIPALSLLCWWMACFDEISEEMRTIRPSDQKFKGLLVQAAIITDKVSDLTKRFGISPADRAKLKTETAGPVVSKVPTRPKTKLDKMGPPKKGK